jgi:AraC-like DNA-binding protein
VALLFGFEPYAFSRKFKAVFGISPTTYRRQARLQRALSLLFSGASSLARIAADLGYHDQSHFTADIKRETGRTPAQLAAARPV